MANAEPPLDEGSTQSDCGGLWVEVFDVLTGMVITLLLNLDPHDMSAWRWKRDTYQGAALYAWRARSSVSSDERRAGASPGSTSCPPRPL
ncbi:hypothetical protein [Serinicoccus marinus]|uniref:hypothetical protein n=1 Tax=Serinicoccus marinus TaxID=247333 RepID=UPI00122E4716|nr:hypothetical protein [Serinicoccus marinus]